MKQNPLDLGSFGRRVRLVRAWRGLAVGLLVGGALGFVWAVLDLTSVWFTELSQLAILFGACGVVGGLVGLLVPVRADAVARSIDRRARLQDRLGTSIEREDLSDDFDEEQRQDAAQHLSGVRARAVFPVRFGR